MVPGAERKLREHQRLTTEYLERHLCSSTHQQRQQYDAISTSERPKYEAECGPLLNKTPPDVCTTNKCLEFASTDINSSVVEAHFVETNLLAGQTVPITVKNHHGGAGPGISYSNFPSSKYGTMPHHGTTLHQGFLGVSDLGSSSSNSSSTYCSRSKTLQHQNRPKKKCVKIETFQTPEKISDFGKRSNTFGYSGSAV